MTESSMANATPLSPVLRGEGSGVRGFVFRSHTPHPQPLSPVLRGEGEKERRGIGYAGLSKGRQPFHAAIVC